MRNKFAEVLYEIGISDPRVFVLAADISPVGSIEKFRVQFPERFIDVGVAEQSLIGISAGLALRGMRPFAYSIATFSAYRPFEMIRVDLCYQNLPVVVVGMGAGIIYSGLGGTHHSQEDVAVLSSLPNMTILAPCDPQELGEATRACLDINGPVYLRIGKAGEATFTQNAADPFKVGKIRYITRGEGTAILCFGHAMDIAHDIASRFAASGKKVSLISCHTMKPFDKEGIIQVLKENNNVIVIEEHSEIGGLASKVKIAAWESGATCTIRSFSLRDEFIHVYGSHNDLRAAHGISADKIWEAI